MFCIIFLSLFTGVSSRGLGQSERLSRISKSGFFEVGLDYSTQGKYYSYLGTAERGLEKYSLDYPSEKYFTCIINTSSPDSIRDRIFYPKVPLCWTTNNELLFYDSEKKAISTYDASNNEFGKERHLEIDLVDVLRQKVDFRDVKFLHGVNDQLIAYFIENNNLRVLNIYPEYEWITIDLNEYLNFGKLVSISFDVINSRISVVSKSNKRVGKISLILLNDKNVINVEQEMSEYSTERSSVNFSSDMGSIIFNRVDELKNSNDVIVYNISTNEKKVLANLDRDEIELVKFSLCSFDKDNVMLTVIRGEESDEKSIKNYSVFEKIITSTHVAVLTSE